MNLIIAESVDKQQSVKMIKVTNIPPVATSDSITYFFENKGKSGGGDIDVILVRFKVMNLYYIYR
jgi:hypothetical protein